MDNSNGAEKLIASIVEDAQKQAAACFAQADEKVEEIRRRLDEDREKLKDEYAEKAQEERADTIRRAVTNAELEGRKEILSRKHALIDRAYKEAYARLCGLKGKERAEVLKKLLVRECSGGETVCPAKADASALSSLIADCGVKGLVMGEPEPSIDGGFILKGGNFVKDCSFAALMEETRAETMEKVAGVLFS